MKFKVNFSRALVIVPHQDDELNIMGGFLPLLLEKGVDIRIVYMINGDYKTPVETRFEEAIAGMAELGITRDKLYFLGYPDVSDESCGKSLYKTKNAILHYHGNKETYGAQGIPEYRMQRDGVHSPCSYEGMKADLHDLLLDVKADVIFAIDFDHHHDHRLCSLCFEQVMEEILLDEACSYCPEVYKAFAYSTAYEAPKDFYNINLLSTPKPTKRRVSQAEYAELEHPYYNWSERVRFPVADAARVIPLRENIMYKAARHYKSQLLPITAQKMVNGDIVAWKRETSYLKKLKGIDVSSGSPSVLRKFSLFDVKDISNFGQAEAPLEYIDLTWTPDKNDRKKTITYTFKESVKIKTVKIYQGVNVYSNSLKVSISAANGLDLEQTLTARTATIEIDATAQLVTLTFSGNENVAIAVVEFELDEACMEYHKIVVNDNFAGDRYYANGVDKLFLSCYGNMESLDVAWKIDGHIINENSVIINADSLNKPKKVSLLACGEIVDEVVLTKLSSMDRFLRKISWLWDKAMVYAEYKQLKRAHKDLKREAVTNN